MKKRLSIAAWIDKLNERVGRGVAWLSAVLVLVVVIDVFSRYFLNDTAAWVMELEWHLFALIFLLAAGYTFRHDKHVRVDLFYVNFSPKDKALVNVVGAAVLLLPWLGVLIYSSTAYAYQAWLIREGSPDPGGLPARYLIKAAIPLGLGLLFLQGVAEGIKNLVILRSPSAEQSENTTHHEA